jgi:hypothetical protein
LAKISASTQEATMRLSVRGWRRDHGEIEVATGDIVTACIGGFDGYYEKEKIYLAPSPVGNDHSNEDARINIKLNARITLNGEYQVGLDFSAQEVARLFFLLYSKSSIEDLFHFFRALEPNPALLRKVGSLPFSPQTISVLESQNILRVGDLVQKSEAELLRTPNLGRKSLGLIKDALSLMGLYLGMELRGWPPDDIEETA